jgi:hypothetical protein
MHLVSLLILKGEHFVQQVEYYDYLILLLFSPTVFNSTSMVENLSGVKPGL